MFVKFREFDPETKTFDYWWFDLEGKDFILPKNLANPQQQFTGLVDIEKNMIFEGDYMQHPEGSVFRVDRVPEKGIFRAVYNVEGDSSILESQIDHKGRAVVIGNTLQNPEMVKFLEE